MKRLDWRALGSKMLNKKWLIPVIAAVIVLAVGTVTAILILVSRSEVASTEVEIKVTEDEGSDLESEEGEEITEPEDDGEELVVAVESEISEGDTLKTAVEYASEQEAVNAWVQYYQPEAGIEVFDVNTQTVLVSHRANVQMRPKSLYKLFYVYDAYAQIDAGVDRLEQEYLEGYTLGTCLDIVIRRSDNYCAEAMYNEPARQARVGQLVQKLGLVSTWSDALRSSAHDISLLLQHYYRHADWSESSWQRFRETALNQPWDYRKGLPSGFTVATVYDKVGWGEGHYNDAAMVEFADGRRFIVVVLTYNTGYEAIRDLGEMLEAVWV